MKLGPAAVVLATLLVVGPVATRLDTELIGIGAVDHFGTLWTWNHALGGGLGHTDALYFPAGVDLHAQNGSNLLDAFAVGWLQRLGLPLGHDLALLAVLLLNGLAGAWVARRRGGDLDAACLAGVATALAPYTLYELVEGRPTQALVAPVLVAVELLVSRRRGAGLALAVAALSYWFYGVFVGLAGGALVVIDVARRDWSAARERFLALTLGTVLVLPFAWRPLWATITGTAPGLRGGEEDFLLHSFQPLLGLVAAKDGERWLGTQRALPLAALVACGFACRRDTPARLLVTLGLTLSIGPIVYAFGRDYTWWPYEALSALLPPLDRLWHPSRALVLLLVPVVYGLVRSPRWVQVALVLLGLGEAARDGLLPLPTWPLAVAPVDRCLSAAPAGAVIDLPFVSSQRHLLAQVVHEHPIAGGFHEGAPSVWPDGAVQTDAAYDALNRAARGERVAPVSVASLQEMGFAYVVLRLDEFDGTTAPARSLARRAEHNLAAILGTPVFQDARAALWTLGGAWNCEEPGAAEPIAPTRDRWVMPLGAWAVRP